MYTTVTTYNGPKGKFSKSKIKQIFCRNHSPFQCPPKVRMGQPLIGSIQGWGLVEFAEVHLLLFLLVRSGTHSIKFEIVHRSQTFVDLL